MKKEERERKKEKITQVVTKDWGRGMTFAFQFLIDFYQKISFLSKNLNKDVQIFQPFTLSPTQWKDLLSLMFLFTFFFKIFIFGSLKKGKSKGHETVCCTEDSGRGLESSVQHSAFV